MFSAEDSAPYFSGTICGYENSTAQEFAEKINKYVTAEYQCPFEPLGEAPAEPELEPTLRGDVDESGLVDVSDAVLLARYLVEDSAAQITDQGYANADADASGKVDSDDVIRIVKMVAKLV